MLPFVLFPCCRLLRKNDDIVSKADTAAVMEGKLKEKLESMGIAFLCLAEASLVPITSWCMYLYLNVIAVATTLSSLCSLCNQFTSLLKLWVWLPPVLRCIGYNFMQLMTRGSQFLSGNLKYCWSWLPTQPTYEIQYIG